MNDTEAALFDLLRHRYPAPEWALLSQVASETGGATRTADAIAMNLWRSRGFALHAFEFKAYRGDLYRELKSPAKAEAVGRYCDYFWIAAANEHVLGGDREIPAPWGVLVVKGEKLHQVKAAAKLDAMPLDRRFLAAVLRRVHEQLTDECQLRAASERGYHEGVEAGEALRDYKQHRIVEDHEALTKVVDDFQAASGVTMSQYEDGRAIGAAVKLVLEMTNERRFDSVGNRIRRLAEQSDEAAQHLRSAAAEFDGLFRAEAVAP